MSKMRCCKFIIVVMIFLLWCKVGAATVKIALLNGRMDEDIIIDLVTVKLSSINNITLLERSSIESVLNEQGLIAAGLTSRNVIKLKGILHTDVIVVINRDSALIFSAHSGCLLQNIMLTGDSEKKARVVFAAIQKSLKKYNKKENLKKLAILSISNVGLSLDKNNYCQLIGTLLEQVLVNSDELAIYERNLLSKVTQERSLSGNKYKLTGAQYFLILEFDQGKRADEVNLTIWINNAAGKELHKIDIVGSIKKPQQLVAELADRLTQKLDLLPFKRSVSTQAEAERFYAEYKYFKHRDFSLIAQQKIEAALALQPENAKYQQALSGIIFYNVVNIVCHPSDYEKLKHFTNEKFSQTLPEVKRALSLSPYVYNAGAYFDFLANNDAIRKLSPQNVTQLKQLREVYLDARNRYERAAIKNIVGGSLKSDYYKLNRQFMNLTRFEDRYRRTIIQKLPQYIDEMKKWLDKIDTFTQRYGYSSKTSVQAPRFDFDSPQWGKIDKKTRLRRLKMLQSLSFRMQESRQPAIVIAGITLALKVKLMNYKYVFKQELDRKQVLEVFTDCRSYTKRMISNFPVRNSSTRELRNCYYATFANFALMQRPKNTNMRIWKFVRRIIRSCYSYELGMFMLERNEYCTQLGFNMMFYNFLDAKGTLLIADRILKGLEDKKFKIIEQPVDLQIVKDTRKRMYAYLVAQGKRKPKVIKKNYKTIYESGSEWIIKNALLDENSLILTLYQPHKKIKLIRLYPDGKKNMIGRAPQVSPLKTKYRTLKAYTDGKTILIGDFDKIIVFSQGKKTFEIKDFPTTNIHALTIFNKRIYAAMGKLAGNSLIPVEFFLLSWDMNGTNRRIHISTVRREKKTFFDKQKAVKVFTLYPDKQHQQLLIVARSHLSRGIWAFDPRKNQATPLITLPHMAQIQAVSFNAKIYLGGRLWSGVYHIEKNIFTLFYGLYWAETFFGNRGLLNLSQAELQEHGGIYVKFNNALWNGGSGIIRQVAHAQKLKVEVSSGKFELYPANSGNCLFAVAQDKVILFTRK